MALDGKCAKCPFNMNEKKCSVPDGRSPKFCSTDIYKNAVEKANSLIAQDPALKEFARQAALQEASCYVPADSGSDALRPVKSRIQETIELCGRMGYHRIGLAFCLGLNREAAALNAILESCGLEVVSVACKVGCTDKSFIGMAREETIRKGPHESMCNPIAQAMVLNDAHTEFNLMLGLCVGHDSMFIKYSDAPVTVVAVKDRLLGNNPIAALYSGYYGYLLRK